MRFTVATKIGVFFALVLSIGLSAIAFIYRGLGMVTTKFEELANIEAPLTESAYEMEININGIGFQVLKYLATENPYYRNQALQDDKDFWGFHRRYMQLSKTERQRMLGDEIGSEYRDFWLLAEALLEYHDLAALAAGNKFRRDLYYRINTLRLTVPPLRERKEDIPLLARDLLARLCAERGQRVLELDEGAERAALEYRWPGNIRELRNVLERAAVLCDGEVVRRRDLSFEGELEATRVEGSDSHLTLEQLERRHIERVLREEQGHVERAAKRLGISRSSLYQKINKYQLQSKI